MNRTARSVCGFRGASVIHLGKALCFDTWYWEPWQGQVLGGRASRAEDSHKGPGVDKPERPV